MTHSVPLGFKTRWQAANQVRRWGDQITPDEQQQWIESYVHGKFFPLVQAMQERELKTIVGAVMYALGRRAPRVEVAPRAGGATVALGWAL